MRKQSASAHETVRSVRTQAGSRPAKSLLDQAYNEIKLRVITCSYRPGEVLSEAAISDELKIGRTPVHQAIHRLMMDGLIAIMPRKGVMVTPVGVAYMFRMLADMQKGPFAPVSATSPA